ncbi:MAG: FecR domain-containing protein [Spirochaetales bacterium]|nr:FecR domain-containing protein [Spirochaetales bacterium]
MNRFFIAAVCIVSLFAGVVTAFGEVVGNIEYCDGDIEITRNGRILGAGDCREGSAIENYDLIRTYGNSELSIVLTSPLSPGTVIDVEPNTTVTIEINKHAGKKMSAFDMLTGGLALKVNKLGQDQDLFVQTESAVMGVRGTSFNVTSSPAGDILVACDEGEVECVDEKGTSLRAVPGEVVEQRPGELFKKIAVKVSNLKEFRRQWIAERIEAFKPNALKAIRVYAGLYAVQLIKFERQYKDLMKNQEIIERWIKEEKEGKTGSTMDNLRDKKKLIGPLFRLRRILFIFERVYFRLLELESYHEQGYGHGTIKPGLTTEQFFKDFNTISKELAAKAGRIRYIAKLYAKRNNGSFPVEFGGDAGDEDDGAEEDDFFGDDDI